MLYNSFVFNYLFYLVYQTQESQALTMSARGPGRSAQGNAGKRAAGAAAVAGGGGAGQPAPLPLAPLTPLEAAFVIIGFSEAGARMLASQE